MMSPLRGFNSTMINLYQMVSSFADDYATSWLIGGNSWMNVLDKFKPVFLSDFAS